MSDCVADQQAGSALSLAAGQGGWWFDNQTGLWMYKDASSVAYGRSTNCALATQGPGFSSDTYVTNSGLKVPSTGLRAGSRIKWTLAATKTAAGIAAPQYLVRLGVNQSTADTLLVTDNGPAQTAVADVAVIEVMLTVFVSGATGSLQSTSSMKHNGAAAGFANNDGAVVTQIATPLDLSSAAGKFLGLSVNGGASAAWTLTQVQAEADW